jgi:Antitoxin ParD
MSRLTIDITDQQHQTLKALAALQGKTIKQYALERLFPASGADEQSLQELKSLLLTRLAEAEREGVVEDSAAEIADEVLRGRGGA